MEEIKRAVSTQGNVEISWKNLSGAKVKTQAAIQESLHIILCTQRLAHVITESISGRSNNLGLNLTSLYEQQHSNMLQLYLKTLKWLYAYGSYNLMCDSAISYQLIQISAI